MNLPLGRKLDCKVPFPSKTRFSEREKSWQEVMPLGEVRVAVPAHVPHNKWYCQKQQTWGQTNNLRLSLARYAGAEVKFDGDG